MIAIVALAIWLGMLVGAVAFGWFLDWLVVNGHEGLLALGFVGLVSAFAAWVTAAGVVNGS